jgi:hypothetical protein
VTRLRFASARQAAWALVAAAALAALVAVWALVTGGFRGHVLGIPLSVRGAERPALAAVVLAIAAVYFDRALPHRLAARVRLVPVRLFLPIVCAAAAGVVLVTALSIGTRAAGGSDVYGYVSQSVLWRQGDLRVHQPIAASVPWPDADWTFAPLGYRPGPNHTIVPTYPPGLPLLMALFALVLGSGAEYLVVPLCGAALVWLTYALGTRVSASPVGATAALCVATSPAILLLTLWSMSDVPVATFWTASLLMACRRTLPGAAAAGLAAGAAILIRPNLAPLALVPAAIASWRSAGPPGAPPLTRFLVFCAASAPAVLFLAWLFNAIYGSPLESGYGDVSYLYAWENIRTNIARYPRWLLESQGPLILLFVVSPFLPSLHPQDRMVRMAFAVFIAIVAASYLVYIPFEWWWYLRFLIPAMPLMFILAADAVWRGTGRFGGYARGAAMLLFAAVIIGYGVGQSFAREVFSVGRGEQKYADVGRHVAETVPANAVVYSMQHTGNIRHYAGRLTLRLNYLDPGWLDRSIEHMRAAGYEPYFVLDDWELPMFTERFATQKSVALLRTEPPVNRCTYQTFVYRVADGHSWRVPQTRCR